MRRPPTLMADDDDDLDQMESRSPSPPPELLAELYALRQEVEVGRHQVVGGQQQLQAHSDLIVRLNADLAAAREGEATAKGRLDALQERLRVRLGGLEAALRQALEREQQQQQQQPGDDQWQAETDLAALEQVS